MTDRRKAMISKIHIARQQLRMADDSYRPAGTSGRWQDQQHHLTPPSWTRSWPSSLGFVQKPARKYGRRPKPVDSRETLIAKIEAQLSSAGRPWTTPTAWPSACTGWRNWNG
jgi:hypothetical protein